MPRNEIYPSVGSADISPFKGRQEEGKLNREQTCFYPTFYRVRVSRP